MLPYCPLPVLQAAHWSAADLRSRIVSYQRIDDPSPASEESVELGLSRTTLEIQAGLARRRLGTSRSRVPPPTSGPNPSDLSISSGSFSTLPVAASGLYFPVPTDDTQGVGSSGLLSTTNPLQGMSNIPDLGPDTASSPNAETASGTKTRPPPKSEKTCFGLLSGVHSLSELSTLTHPEDARWIKTPPFRFSVEFWNLDKLPEKERAYSGTHFYAGSWFNVYVQTIRKKDKGAQLGIYLHRQSPGEPFPTPSAPSRIGQGQKETESRGRENVTALPTAPGPFVLAAPPFPASTQRNPNVTPRSVGSRPRGEEGPYTDPRKATKVSHDLSPCIAELIKVQRRISRYHAHRHWVLPSSGSPPLRIASPSRSPGGGSHRRCGARSIWGARVQAGRSWRTECLDGLGLESRERAV